MEEELIQLRDLLYEIGIDKEDGMAIANPLINKKQVIAMIEWLKDNQQATVYDMVQKSLEIRHQI